MKVEKSVIQLSTKGNILAEYENLMVASEATQIKYLAIRKCCVRGSKITKGFVFLYKRDFENPSDMKKEVERRTHRAKSSLQNPGILFTATNRSTDVVYVGMSVSSLDAVKSRYQAEFNKKQRNGTSFLHDLKELGIEAFDWSVIATANSNEDLKKKRRTKISELELNGRVLYNSVASENSKVLSKGVEQFDLKGNKLESFSSAKEAANKTGIPYGTIRNNCYGNTQTAHNFIFLHSDKYENEAEIKKAVIERVERLKKDQGRKP